MTPEQINKRCAELDGYYSAKDSLGKTWAIFKRTGYRPIDYRRCSEFYTTEELAWDWFNQTHHYTISYDVIIPLIQKQLFSVRKKTVQEICATVISEDFTVVPSDAFMLSTPAQLCEALLRATGKWEETKP